MLEIDCIMYRIALEQHRDAAGAGAPSGRCRRLAGIPNKLSQAAGKLAYTTSLLSDRPRKGAHARLAPVLGYNQI
jgi:hypothetical protein